MTDKVSDERPGGMEVGIDNAAWDLHVCAERLPSRWKHIISSASTLVLCANRQDLEGVRQYLNEIEAKIISTPLQNTDGEVVAWKFQHRDFGEVLSLHPMTDGDRSLGWTDTALVPASALSAMKAERDGKQLVIDALTAESASWRRVAEQCETEKKAAEAERDALAKALELYTYTVSPASQALQGDAKSQSTIPPIPPATDPTGPQQPT